MYSIDLHPAEPRVHAERLSALLGLWVSDCALRLPAATVAGYADKVRYVDEWWSEAGPACDWQLTRAVLLTLDSWLAEHARTRHDGRLSYNTRKDVLRRLRQAFRWSYETKRLPVDLGSWVPQPSGSAPLRTVPGAEQLGKLFDAAFAGPFPLRDATVLAVLIGTGVRRAECAALDAKDVTLYADLSGAIAVHHAKRVKGRSVHARVVAFEPVTGEFLRRWLDGLPALDGALFPVGKHGRIAPQTIYRIVKRCAEQAGVSVQGPHDLRRIFATTFARYRRDAGHLLSLQLGHSSFSQSVRNGYVLPGADDIREAMVSPMSLIMPNHDSA